MKKLAFIFLYKGLDYTEQINLLKIGLNDRFDETSIFYFVEERKKEIITDSVTGEIIDTGRYRQHTQAEILEEIQNLYLKVCNFEVVFVHEDKVLKYVKDFWNVKKINLKVDKEDPKSFLYFQSRLHKVFYKIPKVKFETVYENKKALALLDETLELFMKGYIDHILFDTETTGFCPHRNRIFMFSFADTHRHIGYTIPIWTNTEFNDEKISSIEEVKIKRKLGEVLKHVPISGHNLKFDLQFLETADIIDIQDVKIKTDTHLFAHFLYNDFMGKSSLNLAALCKQFLKVSWKDEIKDYLNENFRKSEQSFDKAPTSLVAEYAAKDAAYNLVLEEYFRSYAPKAAQKFNDEVLNNIVKIVASIECKGIKIDETLESQLRSFYGTMAKDHYLKLINLPSVVKLKENIPAVKERLEFQAKKNSRAKQYTKEELIDKHFSLQSNPQVVDLLYNHLKLKPLTDKPSADKETLKLLYEKYKDDHPEFADFYNHFKYWKRFTKLTADLNRITDNSINGFFHPNYVIVGTRTGRMSSGFHTTDNKSDLKRLYVSRWKDEGGLILSPDFSQAEVRVVASLSKEDSLIEAYEKGYDIHRVTASKTFNIPIEDVTHDQRQQGKTLVFSIIYGKSAKGLGETLGITTDQAEKLLKQFFDGHPNLKRWIETQKDHASKFACVETPWGRRIPIDKINSGHFFKKLAAERKCGNAPVQSAASDAVLWSAAKIQNTLQHYKLKSLIIGMVHDSFEVDVYPGELVQVLNIFKDTCEVKLREFNPWILAPIEISMELGLSWGDGCIEFEVNELAKDSIKIKGRGLSKDALELKRSLSKSYTVKADIDDEDASKENFRPEQFITGKNVNLNLEISP